MKREYTDPNKDNNPAAMFSTIHHRHLLQPYSTSSSSHSPPIHFHHQQLQNPFPFPVVSRDAVDDESSSGGGGVASTAIATAPNNNNNNNLTRQKDNDGASIEVQRRPRGRPPGSKNKPKPPVIITRELPDPIMSPYILEISNSADVIDSVANFSRRRNTGLCILHASGAVSNVTIRQPIPNSSSTVTFHGRFDILSLGATFLNNQTTSQVPTNANLNVAVSLSIPQGQIIGGIVAGPLIAAGTVYVIASSFSSPSFQRLPVEEDETTTRNNTNNQATSSGGNEGQSAIGGDNNNGGGAGGMRSSSCVNNMGSDVIWAPTARQPF